MESGQSAGNSFTDASIVDRFPQLDYTRARERFLQRAAAAGMALDSVPHPSSGPRGEPLAIDVASGGQAGSPRLLVVSSALHGVEGHLGSAIQCDALQQGLVSMAEQAGWRVLMLHGLNPCGFAYDRRVNEDNVDVNRNFVLPAERFGGEPEIYGKLNSWLNPPRAPSRWATRGWFYATAAWAVLRFGYRQVKQAITQGQYEHPRGLFFGGRAPSWTHRVLADQLADWLGDSRQIVHFDVHSGLGRWGTCKLLLDYEVAEWQRQWLRATFTDSDWEIADARGVAYSSRGGWGRWCQQRFSDRGYTYLCAEFGTYNPLTMLAALRAENQGQHWADGEASWVRPRLREMFCPASLNWRRRVLSKARELIWSALGRDLLWSAALGEND